MHMTRRMAIGGLTLTGVIQPRAFAQASRPIRLGVLNDQSGPYRDGGGPTSTACVRQAILEFGTGAFPVELLVGDHQNKPDIGASIARQWLDRDGVERDRGRAVFRSGPGREHGGERTKQGLP